VARCELTGKGPKVKNLVSHSNIKTKSKVLPNVQYKRLFSTALNQMIRFKLATSTLKSIEHSGNLDSFLLQQNDKNLSTRALDFKRRIQRRLRGPASATTAATTAPTEAKTAAPKAAEAPKAKTAAKSKTPAPVKVKTAVKKK
jgi:large subunit ribosomal protein L28